jgi:hypothetical protein
MMQVAKNNSYCLDRLAQTCFDAFKETNEGEKFGICFMKGLIVETPVGVFHEFLVIMPLMPQQAKKFLEEAGYETTLPEGSSEALGKTLKGLGIQTPILLEVYSIDHYLAENRMLEARDIILVASR